MTSAPADRGVDRGWVSFVLPAGWATAGQLVATEFAAGADCVAATIADFEPPTDPAEAGEAGFRLRSTVQVCARPLDGRTLDEFVDETYGDRSTFEPTELAGLDARRSVADTQSVAFVQTGERRYQIVTTVSAEPDLEPLRRAQVVELMGSLSLA